MIVKVRKREHDWHASLLPGEGRWGRGKTRAEAIGDVITSHQKETGIYIVESDAALLAAAEAREHERKLHGECDCGWKQSAAEFHDGMFYYRGLVVKIGELFGKESHIAQDGSDMKEVLCAKVPDLVAALMSRSAEAREATQPTAAAVIEAAEKALKDIRNEVSAGYHPDAPVEELKDGIHFEPVVAVDAALALCARWKEANGDSSNTR